MGPETGCVDADMTSHPGTEDFTLLQCAREHWYYAGFLNSRQSRLLKAHEEGTLILVEIFPLTEVS